jgi:hypothetical protein
MKRSGRKIVIITDKDAGLAGAARLFMLLMLIRQPWMKKKEREKRRGGKDTIIGFLSLHSLCHSKLT